MEASNNLSHCCFVSILTESWIANRTDASWTADVHDMGEQCRASTIWILAEKSHQARHGVSRGSFLNESSIIKSQVCSSISSCLRHDQILR